MSFTVTPMDLPAITPLQVADAGAAYLFWDALDIASGYATVRSDFSDLVQVKTRSLDPRFPFVEDSGLLSFQGLIPPAPVGFDPLADALAPIALWRVPGYVRRGRTYACALTQLTTLGSPSPQNFGPARQDDLAQRFQHLYDTFQRFRMQMVHLQTMQGGFKLPSAVVWPIDRCDGAYDLFGAQRRRQRPSS